MKVALIVVFLVCASASSSLTQANVGSSCMSSPSFNVTSFIVTPWPIYYSQQYKVSMAGTFLADEFVQQIYVGIKNSIDPFWHYSYQQVGKNFTKGQTNTFAISLEGPSDLGSYKEQVVLHRNSLSSLSCWELNFTPS